MTDDMRVWVSYRLGPPKATGGFWWTYHCQVNRPDKNPSLKVEPNGFKCFSCDAYGRREPGYPPPEVTFLVKELGYSWAMAWQEYEGGEVLERPSLPAPKWRVEAKPKSPSLEWRAMFEELWEIRRNGLELSGKHRGYLLDRGLEEATWQHFGLGCNYDWVRVEEFDTWLAPGIIIPATVDNRLWSLEVRVLGGDLKYHRPKGVSEPTPFGLSQLARDDVLIVCEGAFDAMAAWQVCEGRADVLALRGASNSLRHWENYLCYERVILALDADKAGDAAAERLSARYPSWERRRPPEGMDLGDMLKKGELTERWLLG